MDNKIFTKQLEKAQKSGKEAFPQLTDKVGKDEAEVILHTSKGDITVKLFPTLAPKASENFLKHAKEVLRWSYLPPCYQGLHDSKW